MDEARAPNYELAYADYKRGMKYKEIAEKYGVTLSAVKSWASRYWKKKDGCNQKKGKVATNKKRVATRGGQPGNKNAVGNKGGAAPEQNKNAVKTGEFETLFFDTLDQDEMQLIDMIQPDKEQLLLQEIQLLTIRERRMLKRIDSLRQSAEKYEGEDEKTKGMTAVKYRAGTEKDKYTNLTEYTGVLGQIQAIEDALTRVQARRQHAIEMLHKFGFDDVRIEEMRAQIDRLRKDDLSDREDGVEIVNDAPKETS